MISERETRRFRRRVCRFTFDAIDRAALRAIREERPDLAIIRVPTERIDQVHRLEMFGAAPLVADTLVYYGLDLDGAPERPLRNADLEFIPAGEEQRDAMRELVPLIFADYKNHYAANPTLDPGAIRAGYTEWGLSFLDPDPDRPAWLALLDGTPAAFANCAVHEGGVFEGVLYGVHPDFAGRGIYGDLVAFTRRAAREAGHRRMIVSTQIDNLAVQRAWLRQGFLLERSLNTVHLDLLLSDDHFLFEHRETLEVTTALIEDFGAVSGDRNPVHFSDDAARAAGFDGRIAHGAILNAAISRVLGERLPGPGTIYLSQTGAYLRPVLPGHAVTVHVLIKHMDPGTGRILASTRVLLPTGDLAFCGQARVLNPAFAAGEKGR